MDEGRVDGSRQRGGTVTGRRGSGGIARERITRSLPVAPARASASGRAAHCPSCFSRHRDRLILLLSLSLLASGPGGWMAWSLAFLTPFSPEIPTLSLSLSLSLSPPSFKNPVLSGAGPRCSETSHNGVTWPLLSRAHTPRLYPIAYTSPLPESHPTKVNPLPLPPFSSVARVALCIPTTR